MIQTSIEGQTAGVHTLAAGTFHLLPISGHLGTVDLDEFLLPNTIESELKVSLPQGCCNVLYAIEAEMARNRRKKRPA